MVSNGFRTDDYNSQIKEKIDLSLFKLRTSCECYHQLSSELEKNIE